MKMSRRNLLLAAGTGAASTLAAQTPPPSGHTGHEGHDVPASPPPRAPGYRTVRTLNGWTLPYTMKNGVKEFHLVAEEFEHEFAPGCKAKVWGYNGTTPGPTIEVVEGDRVRLLVTNRLKEHTTMHWHGFILPSGMDGVGGLSQPHIQPGETFVYEFTIRQHGARHDGHVHHASAQW
jgi:FtsP/CotA-like multicopper oxidase with cupredoxin domain